MPTPIILKPCPFCGAQPKRDGPAPGLHAVVFCPRERCGVKPYANGSTLTYATRRWNRRAKGGN